MEFLNVSVVLQLWKQMFDGIWTHLIWRRVNFSLQVNMCENKRHLFSYLKRDEKNKKTNKPDAEDIKRKILKKEMDMQWIWHSIHFYHEHFREPLFILKKI